MKKVICVFVVLIMICGIFSSCGKTNKRNLTIGMLLYSDENDPYVSLHINGINKCADEMGISKKKVIIKTNVAVENCYDIITELVDDKCNIIFSVGSGFEDYMVQSATENKRIDYCVCNGTQAQNAEMPNLHSYSTKEYESRYVAGVLAGAKLNDMIEAGEISRVSARIGYVGSVKNTENTSAYSAFFLGAKSVCPDAEMQVQFSGVNHDKELERKAANALIANGNVLIAQHSYLNGAAESCEKNGKYFIGCIDSATDVAPNSFLASVNNDWYLSYKIPIECFFNGNDIPTEWSEGAFDENGFITDVNKSLFYSPESFNETILLIKDAEKKLLDGELHVFDVSSFTVNGEHINSTLRDNNSEVLDDEKIESYATPFYDKEYISEEGYFQENELDSLPMFDYAIDGIKTMN